MLHLPDSNAAFLHCPKTAGMFIRRAIIESGVTAWGVGYQIADAARAKEVLDDSVRRFCFVRHPAAWLRSYWCDRMINGFGGDLPIGNIEVREFNPWVRAVLIKEPGFVGDLFARYTQGAFEIGCVENLAHDLVGILRRLGERPDVGAIYRMKPTNQGSSLTRLGAMSRYQHEVYLAVCNAEKACLDRYGYLP